MLVILSTALLGGMPGGLSVPWGRQWMALLPSPSPCVPPLTLPPLRQPSPTSPWLFAATCSPCGNGCKWRNGHGTQRKKTSRRSWSSAGLLWRLVGTGPGGWHLLGTSSPGMVWTTQSPSSSSSILSLHRGWAHPALTRAARRHWSSFSVAWLCWQPPLSGRPAPQRSWGLYIRSAHRLGCPAGAGSEGGGFWAWGPVPGLAGLCSSSSRCWR